MTTHTQTRPDAHTDAECIHQRTWGHNFLSSHAICTFHASRATSTGYVHSHHISGPAPFCRPNTHSHAIKHCTQRKRNCISVITEGAAAAAAGHSMAQTTPPGGYPSTTTHADQPPQPPRKSTSPRMHHTRHCQDANAQRR